MRTAAAPNQETLPVLSPSMAGQGYAHRNASRTERLAARSVTRTRGKAKLRLLQAYVSAGSRGLTDWEAVRLTGLPMSSVNSCRNALLLDRFLEASGAERLSPYDKPVQVWRASQAGIESVVLP